MAKSRQAATRATRLDARGVAQLLADAAAATESICVVVGAEAGLRRLVVARLVAGAADRDATVILVSAADAGASAVIDRASEPTLFGGTTWLLVTELEQAPEDVSAAVVRAITAASPDLRLLLAHSGAARAKPVVAKAEKAGARMLEVRPIAAAALPGVLTAHARDLGATLTSDAAATLIADLGTDLTGLLACVEQLASDTAEGVIDRDLVADTLVSAGTENQFEIADLVWSRRADEALAAFRGLAERQGAAGACVTVLAALSYSLRTLARYVADRPAGNQFQVASALGIPAWKVDGVAAAARQWAPGQLAAAAVVLAAADADSKGGLGDAGALDVEQKLYAVEALITSLGAGAP